MYGHNVSHSKRRTRKIFKPNLHTARIVINGNAIRMKLCTKCLRMFKAATKPQDVSTMVEATESTTPQIATA